MIEDDHEFQLGLAENFIHNFFLQIRWFFFQFQWHPIGKRHSSEKPGDGDISERQLWILRRELWITKVYFRTKIKIIHVFIDKKGKILQVFERQFWGLNVQSRVSCRYISAMVKDLRIILGYVLIKFMVRNWFYGTPLCEQVCLDLFQFLSLLHLT